MSRISEIADVVELKAWATDLAYSVSSLKEDLEAALPQADEGETAEKYANQVFEELEERQRLLNRSYPFTVDGNTVELATEQTDFAENALAYRSSLAFLQGRIGTLTRALKGE